MFKCTVVLCTNVLSVLITPSKTIDVFIFFSISSGLFYLNFHRQISKNSTILTLSSMVLKVFASRFVTPTASGYLTLLALLSHGITLFFGIKSSKEISLIYELTVFGLHMLSIFANGLQLVSFLATCSLIYERDHMAASLFPISDAHTIVNGDDYTADFILKAISVIYASIFLPFGLNFSSNLVTLERRGFFNLPPISFHVISMVIKTVFTMICFIGTRFNISTSIAPSKSIYQLFAKNGRMLAFLGIFALNPVGSWLEIGLNLGRYIIQALVCNLIFLLWTISYHLMKRAQ